MSPLVIFVTLGLGTLASGGPEVVTSLGKMVGYTLLSRSGREYNVFSRIPYAQQPVGKLRFMAPQPADPWEGVLNATIPSPVCYQNSFLFSQHGMQGQEDCLFINVYTPKLDASYPVMVYIHGGAFAYGSPGSPIKPSYFMDEDVVIVTMSYRLGYLGFLSFEDDVLPGNYGIKDQVLALQWVKQEIANFGGNPNLITAFGISAGGASSHYLCSIPKTRDLLKGCISQSGLGGAIWSLHEPGDGKKMALNVVKKIGCDKLSSTQLLTCLQSKPIESYIPSIDLEHINEFPCPVLEMPSETAVITQWPESSSDFPWIAGFVANEGLLITEYLIAFGTLLQKMEFILGGYSLLVSALHMEENIISNLIKITKKFFKWNDIFHILTDYERLLTEAFWKYPLLKEMNRHNGQKYFYHFEYIGGPSLWEQISNKELDVKGICHGDDASYYFNFSNYYQPDGWPKPKDIELSKTLVKMWVNFATYQFPSINGIKWDQFGEYASYLAITNNGFTMKNFTNYKDVISFWNAIKMPPH